MSTVNHNILYFVHIRGHRFLNPAILPLESSNGVAGRGFRGHALP
jgi:hypothetical protein